MKEINRHKQMERYSMFLDWKNQYCENDYSTKGNLQIQWIPINLSMALFTELEQQQQQQNHNLYGNTKTLTGQSSLEKEKWSWRNQPSWLQIILRSCNHQDSMVLAQKQKYRPMEQARKLRSKPLQIWVLYFWQRRQEYTMGQRQPLQ